VFSYAMPFGWRGGSIVILDLLVLVNSQKYGSVVLSKEMLRSELFKGLGWIEHGFGTRLSQVSQDGMASLIRFIRRRCCGPSRWAAPGSPTRW
jgi:hypothetical protein